LTKEAGFEYAQKQRKFLSFVYEEPLKAQIDGKVYFKDIIKEGKKRQENFNRMEVLKVMPQTIMLANNLSIDRLFAEKQAKYPWYNGLSLVAKDSIYSGNAHYHSGGTKQLLYSAAINQKLVLGDVQLKPIFNPYFDKMT
jgi:hypothetical protein